MQQETSPPPANAPAAERPEAIRILVMVLGLAGGAALLGGGFVWLLG